MERGLRIEFVWHDTDLIQVSIRASNGEFCGTARAYINHDDLKNAASILAGFPNSPLDSREFNFGNMDPQFAGGGISIRWFCSDLRGHAVAEMRIAAEAKRESNTWSRPAQFAHFFADVEAAAVDDFVRELRAFDPYDFPSVSLRFVTR
jgi:hypothetical protein